MDIKATLVSEFHLRAAQVEAVIALLDDGNTIPFIARYRKEQTGSLDDQVLRELAERLAYLRNLNETREKYRATIEEQGALTEELATALDAAVTMTELDDLYRPYRPKRRTRATVAKERGLEPLAQMLYAQQTDAEDPSAAAAAYISDDVPTVEDALAGARDIIAEWIADDAAVRKRLRVVCMANGFLTSAAAKEEDSVYSNYYEFREPLSKVPGHRVLAINRGEREEFLKVKVEFEPDRAMKIIYSEHLKAECPTSEQVRLAAEDSYDRLIFPSLEREMRNALSEAASEAAIKVFSSNLRQLLMQPPVKGKVTLGLDPGYQHGCKTAVIDATGKVLDTGIVYPVPQFKRMEDAKRIILGFIKKYGVEVIAIGNGTASHETEVFVADLIREQSLSGVAYMVVSEAGASVYSASKLAAQEFPDYDVNLRSAVSIARRMQDPLAELVKIDPKAIGVGQYQHDLPQARLTEALGGVVESCVNAVGVDLNTASAPLLEQVAGINATVAKNIVAYREENGAFTSRAVLKKVPKLGPKAFEQCAGFLRVPESKNMLDHTAVHPESYEVAKALLDTCGVTVKDLSGLQAKVDEIGLAALAKQLGVGEPTLTDIIGELLHPGRDPRDDLPKPLLRTDIVGIEALKAGMELKGTVRNVVDFGAFVDIGVHQDGLVHISQITNRFIKHPSEVLKVGDIVTVWVLSVDVQKKRIALTMRAPKES
ncbi:MAG: RNA-binding transcriptional accessory protein [Clostridia bacterium]|nr:RNA-binding transcriptional accessory protein [Clostridia bacterium]